MAMPVLATKLFIPSPRPDAVSRPRLVQRLDGALTPGNKLTVISAPAGFSKTALLSEWIVTPRRREPKLRLAWLSLDERDNDPGRFLSYLEAALDLADLALGAKEHNSPASDEAILTAIINDVAQSPHQIVLVLDDFQLVDDASVHDAVAFLLDNLPSTLQPCHCDPIRPAPSGGATAEPRRADRGAGR